MIAEKIDCWTTVWSKRAGLVLLGWFLSSAVHGTLSADRAVKAVPVLEAAAGCEHHRGDKAVAVAKQAITSANSDVVPTPPTQAIPTDNCPRAVIPKP